jgi:hypothetical protein
MPDVSLRSVDCRGEQRGVIYGRSAPDAMQEEVAEVHDQWRSGVGAVPGRPAAWDSDVGDDLVLYRSLLYTGRAFHAR